MENKCLAKEYDLSVDNKNLPIYDVIRISVYKTDSAQRLQIGTAGSESPAILSFSDVKEGVGGFTLSPENINNPENQTATIPANTASNSWYLGNGTYTLYISNKYGISRIGGENEIGFNLSELSGAVNLTNIGLAANTNIKGNIANLSKLSKINNIALQNNPYIYGDISNLAIATLAALYVFNTKCKGNIETLDVCTAMTALQVNKSAIEGELATLANKMVAKGRTSGTMTVKGSESNCTLNGESFATAIIKFGSSMVNPTSAETAQGWQIAS